MYNNVLGLGWYLCRIVRQLGSLADSINHLLKITLSYWSGLFHYYRVENWPKTNKDLEQVFGSSRHHQRRITGRKKAPVSLLIRGESHLIAAVVTRIKTFTANDLATADLVAWRKQRSQLELLKEKRLQQRRFSLWPWRLFTEIRNPINPVYFATLEKNW